MTVIERLSGLGARPDETPDERHRAGALIVGSTLIALVSFVWVVVYLAYDEPVAAAVPFTYQVVTLLGLVVLARSRRFDVFRTVQLSMFIVMPALLQLVLGGFVASSGVVLWSSVTPLAALALLGPRRAVWWFAAFMVELAVLLVVDPTISGEPAQLPEGIRRAFFVANIAGVTLASFVTLSYFVRRLDEEHERSERLLRNVLPGAIAERLKRDPGVIADAHDAVTVLFADLVGFTEHSTSMAAGDVVGALDEIFTRFDALAAAEGLEKIKTIGDAYMVAGGVPEPRPDQAEAVARVALAMSGVIDELRAEQPWLRIRIGIDSGPLVAGVIGRSRFIYDVWGDTVNTASRMESHGVPDRIQVSSRTAALLEATFVLEPRGDVEIKGKGSMSTFLLVGPR